MSTITEKLNNKENPKRNLCRSPREWKYHFEKFGSMRVGERSRAEGEKEMTM